MHQTSYSLESKDSLLQLVRLGIGTSKDAKISKDTDWESVKVLANQQGLLAVVFDGIKRLAKNAEILPLTTKLRWIGEVMLGYEQVYVQYTKAIADLGAFYNAHGFRMMVLKGYACALNWPKPEHRPCGDIDIWLFGQQEAADKEMVSSFKIQDPSFKIDHSHHHHTVFNWQGFMVENHYDFIEIHHHSSSFGFEKILKEQGKNDCHYVNLLSEKIYLPSPNLHALFLLRHLMEHFASTNINLRQLLDWAFFVEKNGNDVDWTWLENVLAQYGMKELYQIFNSICIQDLGFNSNLFPVSQPNTSLKQKVLNEIFSAEFKEIQPAKLIPRVCFKYRRWVANGWKQKLCYKGSRFSFFLNATWNHILKPKSI